MTIIKDLQPKYLLIAKTNRTPILDRPRPKTEGGIEKRFEAKGTRYRAYKIVEYDAVPYALLESNSSTDEWTRVTEAGPQGFEWWDVTEIDVPQDVAQIRATAKLADAAMKFAEATENAVALLAAYIKFKTE